MTSSGKEKKRRWGYQRTLEGCLFKQPRLAEGEQEDEVPLEYLQKAAALMLQRAWRERQLRKERNEARERGIFAEWARGLRPSWHPPLRVRQRLKGNIARALRSREDLGVMSNRETAYMREKSARSLKEASIWRLCGEGCSSSIGLPYRLSDLLVSDAEADPKGVLVACAGPGPRLTAYSIDAIRCPQEKKETPAVAELRLRGWPKAVRWDPQDDSRVGAVGCEQACVTVHDLATDSRVGLFQAGSDGGRQNQALTNLQFFERRQGVVAACSEQCGVFLWDSRCGSTPRAAHRAPSTAGMLESIEISRSDENVLFVGALSGACFAWDVRMHRGAAVAFGSSQQVRSLVSGLLVNPCHRSLPLLSFLRFHWNGGR